MQIAFKEIIYCDKRYVGIRVSPKRTRQFYSQECRVTWNLIAEHFYYSFDFTAFNIHLKTHKIILLTLIPLILAI
jgi:hypothetical protein